VNHLEIHKQELKVFHQLERLLQASVSESGQTADPKTVLIVTGMVRFMIASKEGFIEGIERLNDHRQRELIRELNQDKDYDAHREDDAIERAAVEEEDEIPF
jgi:hypothetical protein